MAFFDPSVSLVDPEGRPSEAFFKWLIMVELQKRPVAVANLPTAGSPNKGLRYVVSNATTATFNSVVAGGGAVTVPVFCDGTNWRIG